MGTAKPTAEDFERLPNLNGIWSSKWGYCKEETGREDVISMWVADMDFEGPAGVKQAVVDRAENGVYGYTRTDPVFTKAVTEWFRTRHNWAVQAEWLRQTPGVICAIHTAVRAFTGPNDSVLVQPPVYHPFFRVMKRTGRRILENPLVDQGDHYAVDFKDFEEKIRKHRPKLFLLCNPHNPVGRVFSEEELRRMGEICFQYDVTVISDEIHCDLTAPGIRHVPFASLGDRFAERCIVCTAPSKTFNLAGLQLSNIVIPDKKLREAFTQKLEYSGIPGPNLFALTAAGTAYESGAEWLDQARAYIQANRAYTEEFVKQHALPFRVYQSEGTYFVWLDMRQTGLSKEALEQFLIKQAGVWFNQGYIFGAQGEGFVRINIACPRSLLEQALGRIAKAWAALPAQPF